LDDSSSLRHYLSETNDQEVQEKFKKLAQEWGKATSFHSSIKKKVTHPAYLAIIEIGKPVIPFLLKDLEHKPEHWFVALSEIIGENPIPEKASGRMDDMAKAWLD
jgi:hypothetical protein